MFVTTNDIPTSINSVAYQRLKSAVRSLLNRPNAHGNIERILNIDVSDIGIVTGQALGRDFRPVDFEIDPNKHRIAYKLSTHSDRSDSQDGLRLDGIRSRPARCGKGISCHKTCISANKTCRLPGSAVATNAEMGHVRQLALAAKSSSGEASATPKDYKSLTIRELQDIARDKGVYRSNHQKKGDLINTLQVLEQDPQSQEKLRRTLQRKHETRRAATKSLPRSLVDLWKGIKHISRSAGSNPSATGLLAAGLLAGMVKSQVDSARDRYRSGLNDSAKMAMERAQKLPTATTGKDNIMFTVGGFAGTGSRGDRMKDILEAPMDNTKGESWFGKNNHIVPVIHQDFDIPTPSHSKRDAEGKYNPLYLASVAQQSFGKYVNNLNRGRNDAAVDLASQIYAYGDRYPNAQLNVLGHGAGGNVVREATEIVSRMKPGSAKGVEGSKLLERLNIVNLGTPTFGFSNDKGWRNGDIKHRTITSANDPFSFLPKQAAQWISSVRGGEAEDYLKNPDVRERLREAFNYYGSSIAGRKEAEKRRTQNLNAIGEAISIVNPVAGKLWNQVGAISQRSQGNPVATGILAGALVTGTGVATYSNLRSRYQKDIPTSAMQAEMQVRSQTVGTGEKRKTVYEVNGERVPHVPNTNITFVVGGVNSKADDVIDSLPDDIKGTRNKKGSRVGGASYFVPFDDEVAKSTEIPGDRQDLGHNAQILKEGYGKILGRTIKTIGIPGVVNTKVQNPEAVRLAAQMFAYAKSQERTNGKNYQINMLAANTGGTTAREALEILAQMGKQSGVAPEGRRIATKVKFVTMGTPSFGLTNEDPGTADKRKYVPQELNLIGDRDPVGSRLPNRGGGMSVQVTGVGGHDAKSYLQSEQTVNKIRDIFGYTAPTQQEKKQPESVKEKPPEQAPPIPPQANPPEQPPPKKSRQRKTSTNSPTQPKSVTEDPLEQTPPKKSRKKKAQTEQPESVTQNSPEEQPRKRKRRSPNSGVEPAMIKLEGDESGLR